VARNDSTAGGGEGAGGAGGGSARGDSPAVEVADLVKNYTDFWGSPKVRAVDGLSFEIERGEVFGLLGPNGSGKTTTIKILLGLLWPTSGEIRILGRPPRDVAVKARIGFLPEESYLYRFLTGEETLDFFGRLFGLPRKLRRKRTDELLEKVGLTAARRRAAGEYSKGMGRRLGLATALINDPELVILDEPTSGLDPIGTREVKDLTLRLREEGKTVLLSSHLLADVEDVCDRVLIIDRGARVLDGRVDRVLERRGEIQFTAAGLDSPATRDVEEAIRKRGRLVETSHPREKLESLFLRVVGAERKPDEGKKEKKKKKEQQEA